jgi:hypothetical protein
MRASASAFVLGVALLAALPAMATDRWRLVLMSEPGVELTQRVRAEAADVGLELVVEPAIHTGVSPSTLADRRGAIGVLRVSSPSTVELWIASGEERSAGYETIRAQPGEGESFAFRVVEEVRARLTKLNVPEADANVGSAGGPFVSRDLAPTSAAGASGRHFESEPSMGPTAPKATHALAASAGVGASTASGGTGSTLHAAFALRATFAPSWSASAQALVPFTQETFSAPEGSAKLRAYLVSLDIARDIWTRASWSAALGAGAGGVILTMDANPTAGYVGRGDHLTSGIFFLDAHLKADATRWLSIHGTLMAGASAPRAIVRFDGREVAAWGRAFAAAMLTLDFVIPLGPSTERP